MCALYSHFGINVVNEIERIKKYNLLGLSQFTNQSYVDDEFEGRNNILIANKMTFVRRRIFTKIFKFEVQVEIRVQIITEICGKRKIILHK